MIDTFKPVYLHKQSAGKVKHKMGRISNRLCHLDEK